MSEVFDGNVITLTAGTYQFTVNITVGAASFQQTTKETPIQLLPNTSKTADDKFNVGPIPDSDITVTLTGDAKAYIEPVRTF